MVRTKKNSSPDAEIEIFYQALLARDRRFDGRVFTGVRTTGVYCRPICPARTPLQKNVLFFNTAAAAEAAGFRPCRRCRPETAPGTPAWIGSSATVARALRLIREGSEEGGLPALAARLGVGERRLRQLFDQHLGAAPQAVVRVQRLDFARRLINETSLPMTEVAASAGFRSIRRFNDAVKTRFGKPPRLLRRDRGSDGKNGHSKNGDEPLRLHLPYRPPYAWEPLLAFLSARAIPGVETVSASTYARTLTLKEQEGWLEVRCLPEKACLELRISLSSSAGLMEAIERVRTLFDLDADPLPIAAHLGKDARLAAAIAATPGLRVPGGWDGFELAVRAILGQQVSVQGASTLSGRLARAFGRPLTVREHGSLSFAFPEPAVLAAAEIESIGLPKARAAALRSLSQRVLTGELLLNGAADLAATEQALLQISGIGPWTAQYIAMRVLRDPDAFPATDLVLRRLLESAKDQGQGQQTSAESWRPWRAYAAMYLWHSAASSPSASASSRRPSGKESSK